MFCGPQSFRDLSADPEMRQLNRDARARGLDNPLFNGGDLLADGIIYREIPEITAVSNGTIDCNPNYLVGAQAIGVGYAQRTKTTTQVTDYGYRNGVGVQEMRGIEKLLFGNGAGDTDDLKQHGVVTVWTAGVADA